MKAISKSYNMRAKPSSGYLFSLWGFMLLFVVVMAVLVTPFLALLLERSFAKYATLLLQGGLIFALPAWLVEQYYRRSHFESIWRLRWRDTIISNAWRVALLLILGCIGGLALEAIMSHFPTPRLFVELDRVATEEYAALLAEERWGGRLLIYVATIIVAPLSEELFFRGGVQGWLLARFRNAHLAVWLSALLFSAMHMQWSGFPSRLLLGGVLGYVALYGGLWLAVIFHLMNNASVFIFGDANGLVEMNGLAVLALLLALLIAIGGMVISMKREAIKTASKANKIDDDE